MALSPAQRSAKQERDRAYRARVSRTYGVSTSTRTRLKQQADFLDINRETVDSSLIRGASATELRDALKATAEMQEAWRKGEYEKASALYKKLQRSEGLADGLYWYHTI